MLLPIRTHSASFILPWASRASGFNMQCTIMQQPIGLDKFSLSSEGRFHSTFSSQLSAKSFCGCTELRLVCLLPALLIPQASKAGGFNMQCTIMQQPMGLDSSLWLHRIPSTLPTSRPTPTTGIRSWWLPPMSRRGSAWRSWGLLWMAMT